MPASILPHGILTPSAAIYYAHRLRGAEPRSNYRVAMGDITFLLIGLGFFAAFGFYAIFCDRR